MINSRIILFFLILGPITLGATVSSAYSQFILEQKAMHPDSIKSKSIISLDSSLGKVVIADLDTISGVGISPEFLLIGKKLFSVDVTSLLGDRRLFFAVFEVSEKGLTRQELHLSTFKLKKNQFLRFSASFNKDDLEIFCFGTESVKFTMTYSLSYYESQEFTEFIKLFRRMVRQKIPSKLRKLDSSTLFDSL